MPIALGSGSTQGGEVPVPVEMLLRKKGGRALRLQRPIERLNADGLVSAFAQQADMEPEKAYAVVRMPNSTRPNESPFCWPFPRSAVPG